MDLRINSGLRGRLLYFLPMLIKPRQKKHVSATKSPKTCKDIGRDRGIGMPDMGDVVDVINRGGDVERLVIAHKGLGRLRRGCDKRVTEPQQNVFKRHMKIEMSRRLPLRLLDVA